MTRVVSTDDIALLLSTFSIPESLVRDRSGAGLVRWETALERCHDVLQRSASRIPRTQLPALLDLDDDVSERLFEHLDTISTWSKDGRQLVPDRETQYIMDDLKSRAKDAFVDLKSFSREPNVDISLPSLERLLSQHCDEDLRRVSGDTREATDYVCSVQSVTKIKDQISHAISTAGLGSCNLTDALGRYVPPGPLKLLAAEVVAGVGGSVRLDAEQVIASPAEATGSEPAQASQRLISECVERIVHDGFCLLPPSQNLTSAYRMDEVLESVLNEFRHSIPEPPHIQVVAAIDGPNKSENVNSQNYTTALLRQDSLEQTLDLMRDSIRSYTSEAWNVEERSTATILIVKAATVRQNHVHMDLAEFLLRTEYLKDFQQVVGEQLERLEDFELTVFTERVLHTLICPFQLYVDGTAVANEDETLKQHLEACVLDHFRRDVVPQSIEALEQQNLLRDKARRKETLKLKQSTSEAKDLSPLKSAVARFMRKTKIEPPNSSMLKVIKQRTVQQSLRAMRRMTRGSDILQNLMWICFASVADGLFISSGKDTSRMLKTFSTISDKESSSRLMQWRDQLKTGTGSREDLQEMREMAMRTVEGMEAANARGHP